MVVVITNNDLYEAILHIGCIIYVCEITTGARNICMPRGILMLQHAWLNLGIERRFQHVDAQPLEQGMWVKQFSGAPILHYTYEQFCTHKKIVSMMFAIRS